VSGSVVAGLTDVEVVEVVDAASVVVVPGASVVVAVVLSERADVEVSSASSSPEHDATEHVVARSSAVVHVAVLMSVSVLISRRGEMGTPPLALEQFAEVSEDATFRTWF
jgi:hypothetical protein